MKTKLSIGLLLTLLISSVHAEPRYISDVLYVPLRSGTTMQHRIVHKGLKSGTEVELLQLDEEGNWSLVRTKTGIEGWVQNQYLLSAPAARQKLAEVTQQLKQLTTSGDEKLRKLAQLQQENSVLIRDKKSLEEQNSALSKELNHIKEISANAVRIDQANSELIKKNQLMEVEIEQLKVERDKLENDNTYKGLKYGAIILGIGFFVGFLTPMLRNSRRNNSWV